MAFTKNSLKSVANTKASKIKGKRLTPAQKSEIASLWRSGEFTMTQIAEKYGKDISTIRATIRAEGAVKGEVSEKVREKVESTIEKSLVSDAEMIAGRIREAKEEHWKMASGLAKLVWKTVVEAQKAGHQPAVIADDMKALQLAANTLSVLRKERYAVLGIRDFEEKKTSDDEIPELVIKELTSQEIKKMVDAKTASMQSDDLEELDLPSDDLDSTEVDLVSPGGI